MPYAASVTGLADPARLTWCCVLAGVGLVLLTFETSLVYSAAVEDGPAGRGYDVFTPRLQKSRAAGLGARLFGAHCNALEDAALFGVAVACASSLGGVDAAYVAALACLHVVYRAAHWAGYVLNVPAARAAAYIMGFQTTAFVLVHAIFGHRF